MQRFEILAHAPPPTDEDKMAEAATFGLSERVPNTENVPKENQESRVHVEDIAICEIEFVKSRIVILSSCDELYKERSRDIHYKSCGQIDPYDHDPGGVTNGGDETARKVAALGSEQVGPPKTRRFRRISLPQWLHKSSKKFSRDEVRGRWATGSRKRRMMRANSAPPKTLGVDARNGADKNLTREEFRLATKEKGNAQVQINTDTGVRGHASRRISLPTHASLNTNGMERLGDEERIVAAGGKQARKYTVPSLLTENEELQILRRSINVSPEEPTPSAIRPTQDGLAEKIEDNQQLPNRASSFSVVSESRDSNSRLESIKQKRMIDSPKLQRFKKPDMFYIPLPDDTEENGTEKIVNVMCRARRVEPSCNQNQEAIHEIIEYQLQSYLRQRVFLARCSQQWCLDLSQAIKVRVQNLREGYKVVCVVYIAAVRGQGLHAAVECTWSPKDDNFVVASYKNPSLFAIASVLALKYN